MFSRYLFYLLSGPDLRIQDRTVRATSVDPPRTAWACPLTQVRLPSSVIAARTALLTLVVASPHSRSTSGTVEEWSDGKWGHFICQDGRFCRTDEMDCGFRRRSTRKLL